MPAIWETLCREKLFGGCAQYPMVGAGGGRSCRRFNAMVDVRFKYPGEMVVLRPFVFEEKAGKHASVVGQH